MKIGEVRLSKQVSTGQNKLKTGQVEPKVPRNTTQLLEKKPRERGIFANKQKGSVVGVGRVSKQFARKNRCVHLLGGSYWGGVGGVGGIFPFLLLLLGGGLRFFVFFFPSILPEDEGKKNCNLLQEWGISLRPRLHRPRAKLPEPRANEPQTPTADHGM